MTTLTRKIVVPTVLLGTLIAAGVAYAAWESVRELTVLEAKTRSVRTASALAYALDDAAQEEDRWLRSLARTPDRAYDDDRDRASGLVAEIMAEIRRLPLTPRAERVWANFVETRAALVAIRDSAVEMARLGSAEMLRIELSRWRLMTTRSDALLKDFNAYHLRYLDRTVAELQERRVRALWATVLGAVLGLLTLVALAFAVGRAVVRPIVAVARAAERIATTGRPSEVGGAERSDEIGTLARSFNDMTRRLLAANAQLEEADRRKDEFLGMLSHELRNPLAPMRNSIFVLERADPLDPAAARAREVLSRQVGHLTRLVDDLLDVTRIARGKIELRPADLDLGELVRRTGADHGLMMLERGHEFVVDAPPRGALHVYGDETRLAQAIGNLLHNAAKFTVRGGRIHLSARRDGDFAEVRVRDTGIGIEPQMLASVFEPFTQGEQSLARTDGGLGLGLAVVKGMVEHHAGTVAVESAGKGQGAEFVIRLPVRRERAPDPASPATLESSARC